MYLSEYLLMIQNLKTCASLPLPKLLNSGYSVADGQKILIKSDFFLSKNVQENLSFLLNPKLAGSDKSQSRFLPRENPNPDIDDEVFHHTDLDQQHFFSRCPKAKLYGSGRSGTLPLTFAIVSQAIPSSCTLTWSSQRPWRCSWDAPRPGLSSSRSGLQVK